MLRVSHGVRQLTPMGSELRTARYKVTALLIALYAITYLDRVCISVAGPRMQEELGIDTVGWGWVTGMFGLAYCIFEIPSGMLGDRIGARKVLTRIVLWWSGFTALTGVVTQYYPLLIVRFLFGAGEAGAFPNGFSVISKWFPASNRAFMSGVTLMSAQVGGALAPLIVLPIQMQFGWRASFFFFALLGAVWAAIWYAWFRDSPEEKLGLTAREKTAEHHSGAHKFPWRSALRSRSVIALLVLGFSYIYTFGFFQTWFHTFLVKGRGFDEANLFISSLPYVIAVCTNLLGGAASDALVRRFGKAKGRRGLGVLALSVAGLLIVAVMATHDQTLTVILLGLAYGAITFQQSGACGACLDLGHRSAGTMAGLFNTSSYLGSLVGSVAYGYIADRFGYEAPFIPMAGLLFLGAVAWMMIDASEQFEPEGLRGDR